MRPTPTLAVGLLLSLPIISNGLRLEADGLLKRHHHHHGDGDAESSTVVRLPAQNVRVETTRPRVVVRESHLRARGFLSAPAFAPVAHGPLFATVLPMTIAGATLNAPATTGSAGLDSVHAMERHQFEVNQQRAALAAQMQFIDKTLVRVQANIAAAAPAAVPSAPDDVKAAIDALSSRIADVERLLILHDKILKEGPPKKK